MIGEQKAKALFAGGIALFVTGLVVLVLLVIPAAQHSQVAMAQGPGMPAEGGPPGEGGMPPRGEMPGAGVEGGPPGGYPGGGPGMGGEMGGGEMGGGGAAEAPEEPTEPVDPLEPSRENPFAPRSAIGMVEGEVIVATTYGPDWSELPIAERVAFVRPDIPSAPTPPAPRIEAMGDEEIRVTSILWDASGQAQAAYEDSEGNTGVVKPGERIHGMTVREITGEGVVLETPATGETRQLQLRPRTEKAEPERPQQRRPGAPGARQQPQTGGRRPPRG